MTKEEALGRHWIAHNKKESDEDTQLWLTADEIETVHAAMDEYAKQEAIAFAVWASSEAYWYDNNDKDFNHEFLMSRTPEELYEKFKRQQ